MRLASLVAAPTSADLRDVLEKALDPYKSSVDVDSAAAGMGGMRVVDVEKVVCEAARVAQQRLDGGGGGKDEITMEDFAQARASLLSAV